MKSAIFEPIFQDQDILLIEKKKAFISQRGDQGEKEGLYEFISRHLGFELFPVHRLDREVLGLMIFGRNRKSAEALSEQFRMRLVRKSYSCWVYGRPPKESDRLVHYLKKNPKTNYTTVFPRPTEGAKQAVLSYFVDQYAQKSTRLEVHLETGRSHQIRAQLSKIGCPILGDTRYAKRREPEEKIPIQLKSVRLGFFHPRLDQFMEWKLAPLRSIEVSL